MAAVRHIRHLFLRVNITVLFKASAFSTDNQKPSGKAGISPLTFYPLCILILVCLLLGEPAHLPENHRGTYSRADR